MPTEAAYRARGECKQSLPHAANGAQADGPERHCAPTDCGPAAQGRHGSMPPQKQGCCAKQAVSHCHTAHFATQYGLFCIVKRPVSQTNANAVVTHCHPNYYCVLYKLKEQMVKNVICHTANTPMARSCPMLPYATSMPNGASATQAQST